MSGSGILGWCCVNPVKTSGGEDVRGDFIIGVQHEWSESEELIVHHSDFSFHFTNTNYFSRNLFLSSQKIISLWESIKYFIKINRVHLITTGLRKIFTRGPRRLVIMAAQQLRLFCEIPRSYQWLGRGHLENFSNFSGSEPQKNP